jgi:hypothetical protein
MCDVTLASRYSTTKQARGVLCPGTIAPRDLACMHGDLQAEECALIWPGVPFYDETGTGPLREDTPQVYSLLCFNLMMNTIHLAFVVVPIVSVLVQRILIHRRFSQPNRDCVSVERVQTTFDAGHQ